MPTLDFKGKSFVYAHHLSVPFRELVIDVKKSLSPKGEKPSLDDNLIIHGDNLHALKALLPVYAGKVDCIFIDPPYNTGHEGWSYNDNVRSPLMREWLKSSANPVEKDDLERHDKWLCMMWPRLHLLRELLAEDGSIFVCINDIEQHQLRCLMDEIFGEQNFLATLVWEKGKKGDSKFFSNTHEYVLVYAKNKEGLVKDGTKWRIEKEGADEVLAQYSKLRKDLKGDHAAIRKALLKWYADLPADAPARAHKHYNWSDDRGLYFAADFAGPDDGRKTRPRHDIYHPITKKPCAKPSTGWRWDEAKTDRALAANPPLIHFGPDHTTIPNRKTYLKDVTGEAIHTVFYKDGRAATLQVEQILGPGAFQYPKDTEIVARLIAVCSDESALVLDSFAGSGTTCHAVLSLNESDGGNRKFIAIQLPEPIAADSKAASLGYKDVIELTTDRVRKAIVGYTAPTDVSEELFALDLNWSEFKRANAILDRIDSIERLEGASYDSTKKELKDGVLRVYGVRSKKQEVPGLGGSFTFASLGPEMSLEKLLADGLPTFEALAKYVFYTATGTTLNDLPTKAKAGFIGETAAYRVHMLYKADKAWLQSNEAALTERIVDEIVATNSEKKRLLVFAAAKFMSQRELSRRGIDFCQLPYAIHRILGD